MRSLPSAHCTHYGGPLTEDGVVAISVHSICPSIPSVAVAVLTIPAQRLPLKRIRQKIGRIGITARVRFPLSCRWRGNDAHAKTGKLRTRNLVSWARLHEYELGLWPGSRQGRDDQVNSYRP